MSSYQVQCYFCFNAEKPYTTLENNICDVCGNNFRDDCSLAIDMDLLNILFKIKFSNLSKAQIKDLSYVFEQILENR